MVLQVFFFKFNHKISREENKTIFSISRISEMTLRDFSVPRRWLTGQFRLMTSRNGLSPEDDYRQLVSLKPLFRFSKMAFRRHQITEDDLPGSGWFRLVVSRNWLASVISLFPKRHIPGFHRYWWVIFRILGLVRMRYIPFYLSHFIQWSLHVWSWCAILIACNAIKQSFSCSPFLSIPCLCSNFA